MFRIIIMALLVLTSATLPARAEEIAHAMQDNQPQEIGGFARLLEKLKQHPEIASMQAKAESSEHYAKGELGLPDPMLNVQVQNYPIGSSNSTDFEEKMIGFKQEIPAFGTRGAKSEKVQAEAHKSKLAADYAFATMKAKLVAVLATWQRIKKEEKLLGEQASLFTSERTSIKGRIAANQAGVSQLSMSQADSTELQIMRAELEEEKHDVMAMLTNMVGETPDVELPPVVMAAWDHDADKTYPVKIAAEDITMAHKEVDASVAEFGPHFSVEADYGRFNNNSNASTIMVGVSIPLWASESQRPKLNGAKAALHSSELDQDTVRRDVIEKLDHLHAQIDTSAQKIELLKTKNTNLEASAKALTREYEAGKADLAMYLKTRRDALSARIALAQERAKRIALIADFNHYIVGDSL
jgi:outer membrane protein TolC